jgi:hypothetical protein
LRALAEGPEVSVLDRAEHRSLLSLASLAIVRGCLEPKDEADGLSLADAVNALVPKTAPPAGRSGGAAASAPAAGPARGQGMPPAEPSD